MRKILRVIKHSAGIAIYSAIFLIFFVAVFADWLVNRRWRELRDMRIHRFI